MLRVSTQTHATELDLDAVNGNAESASRVRFGAELVRFAAAVATREPDELAAARAALLAAAGPRVLVDAAGVAANFQRMVRIADATGIPVDDIGTEMSRQIRDGLNLERFASARNTPGAMD